MGIFGRQFKIMCYKKDREIIILSANFMILSQADGDSKLLSVKLKCKITKLQTLLRCCHGAI